MNSVSKNIKRLRKRDNISQEILAEKLNVTRQAVSSWETAKTQPDIDTLISVAAVFNVDVTELIYGEKQILAAYPQDRKKRILRTYIFGSISAVFILLEIFVVPYLRHLVNTYYIAYPYMITAYLLRPFFYICISLFFFNILSLWYDFRIKRAVYRKAALYAGLLCIASFCLMLSDYFFNTIPINTPFLSFYIIEPLITNPALFFIPGTALFFGLNK